MISFLHVAYYRTQPNDSRQICQCLWKTDQGTRVKAYSVASSNVPYRIYWPVMMRGNKLLINYVMQQQVTEAAMIFRHGTHMKTCQWLVIKLCFYAVQLLAKCFKWLLPKCLKCKRKNSGKAANFWQKKKKIKLRATDILGQFSPILKRRQFIWLIVCFPVHQIQSEKGSSILLRTYCFSLIVDNIWQGKENSRKLPLLQVSPFTIHLISSMTMLKIY